MIRVTLILIGTVAVLNVANAANENMTIEEIYDMASNILNATDKWQNDLRNSSVEGRKSKFFPFGGAGLLPFHALWGFGGLNALGILFAIKIKIIIVIAVVAFSVYYYTKLLAMKKCHGDHYRDREGAVYPENSYSGSLFYSNPVTSYSSPFATDISGHSSYPSIEPYSAYHDSTIHSDIPSYAFDHDHHDHHDFHHEHDYHHDHHDFDHFTDHTSSHDIPTMGVDSSQSAIDDPNSSSGSAPSMSHTYRRVGKHRRRRAAKPQVDFIDLGELAFRFLGVDTEGCRKRFVCELDFRAQSNPITRLAFSFIGRNFFERYRDSGESTARPQKFSDCGKIFTDCKDAEKYNNNEEEEVENEENEENEEKEEKPEKNDIVEKNTDSDEVDEKEGSGDTQEPKEYDSSQAHRKETREIVRNFIINRKISIV